MASGGDVEACKSTLREYKERTEKADAMKLSPFLKCVEACGLKQYKTTIESSIWALHQDAAKKVTIDKVANNVIQDLAADVVARKRGQTKGRAPLDDPEVVDLANTIRGKFAAKAGQAAHKASKADATTQRLTDVSGYTGSHKERFDESGKGKGKGGRENLTDNTGYVGNYKGEGTYDKKH